MYEREIERKKSVHYESGRKKRMKERKKNIKTRKTESNLKGRPKVKAK
jgi:hypothetical protein